MKYSELLIIFEKFLITDGKKLRLRQKKHKYHREAAFKGGNQE